MKKQTKMLSLAFASTLMFAAAVSAGVTLNAPTAAALDDVTFTAEACESLYSLNDVVDIPSGTFSYGGKTYEAMTVVHFPTGKAYMTDNVKLTETGKYSIEYRTEIDGELVSETRSFDTLESMYSVGSARSSMQYGKPTELGVPFTTDASPKGLYVKLAKGDVFTYTEMIDLNDSSELNKFFRFYLTPQQDKTADAYSMYTKLTDAYDPNNYIMISHYSYTSKVLDSNACRANYVTSCVPGIGQSYTAYYHTFKSGGVGEQSSIFKSMRTSGHCSFVSFYGNNQNGDVTWDNGASGNGWAFKVDWGYAGYHQVGYWMDYANKQLHNNTPMSNLSTLVTDYDDPGFYASKWDGFTTGECYVSFWAEDYNQATFDFVVTGINGIDLSGTEPETHYRDEDKPTINEYYGDYTSTDYPDAKVNCAYPVFDAEGIDGYDGEVDVTARAFYGYGTDNCYEVTCTDAFIPDRVGEYTIVYTAKDRAGNETQKLVTVNAVAEATAIAFDANVADAPKAGVAGQFIDVATATYSGGVGAMEYIVTAKNQTTGTEYTAENGQIRPMEEGVYTVTCTAKDFIGQTATATYDVTIAASAGPVFETLPQLPQYFMIGYEYKLPEAYAGETKAEVYLEDNSQRTKLINNNLNVAGDTRDVKIVYVATKNGNASELVFSVPAINVKDGKKIDGAKYFAGANITTASTTRDVTITAASGAEKVTSTYINPVLAEKFSAKYSVTSGNFGEFALYLTDSVDQDQVVKFSWKNVSGTSFMYVNNKLSTVSTMFDFNGYVSNFTWNNASSTFTDITTNLSVTVAKTLSGEAFSGFTSGKVYMSLEMNKITGDAAIKVTELNNQTMGLKSRDVIDAEFTLLGGSYFPKGETGDVISLIDCLAADVLSANTTVKLTVKDPDGNAVKSTTGETLQNVTEIKGSFTLEKVGKYVICYTVSDGANSLDHEYIIDCSLENNVSIAINGAVPTEGKVGEAIVLPEASFTAAEGTAKGYVLYINAEGVITGITSTRTFTPDKAGMYVVIYQAYDSSNNVNTVSFTIEVK